MPSGHLDWIGQKGVLLAVLIPAFGDSGGVDAD